LALIADLAVEVVLGPAWAATGPILALLAPAGFFLCVYSFMGAVLMGLGRSEYQFRLILLSGVCLALGVILGGSYGGEGVACGFSFGAALAVPFYLYAFSRQLGIPVAQIVRETSAPLVATLAMAVGVLALERALPDWPPAVGLAALVLAGAISFGVVLAAISGRRVWADLQWLFAPHRAAEPELP
jgi:PST family polysaccharide transporter